MKAILFEKYGAPDVLQIRDIPKPKPQSNELLVRVFSSTINYGDISARNFANIHADQFNMPSFLLLFAKIAFGRKKPRIQVLGSEFSGEIEEIGESVRKFKKGDQVFGYTGMKMGAHAEYLCIKENGMVGLKPDNMSHEEACAIPYGGIMAIDLLRRVPNIKGRKALVNGASGGIGSTAVQILKYYGAGVTGVCSADRMNYTKALGADYVLDYTKKDNSISEKKYDLIFDILGKLSWSECKKMLTEYGICLFVSFKTDKLAWMLISRLFGKRKAICAFANEKQTDLEILRSLTQNGYLKTTVDRVFPFEEAAKAHEYYENKKNRGRVILKIQ